MTCLLPSVPSGSRNVRLRFLFQELDSSGAYVPLALPSGTTGVAYFRRPDRELVTVPLVVDSPPEDGSASFFTTPGFLDYAGTWSAVGAVTIPGSGEGTGTFFSRATRFEVSAFLRELAGLASSSLSPTPADASADSPAPVVTVA